MLLCTIIVGLIGALLMFAGDMLLYYTPEDFKAKKAILISANRTD